MLNFGQHPDTIFAGRYRLLRKLGEGGFGEVWAAEDLNPGHGPRQVAIKFFHRSANLEEVQLLAQLDHPFIVRFINAATDGSRTALVTEQANRSLREILVQQGAIAPDRVQRLLSTVAEALCYLHEQVPSIVHRDVKPENILIVAGVAKLGDVGIAKHTTHTLTSHSGLMSSLYAAPEMWGSRGAARVGPKSDVYALGLMALELLAGRHPFEDAESSHVVMRLHCDGVSVPQDVPEALRPAIERAVLKDPAFRWTSREFSDFWSKGLRLQKPRARFAVGELVQCRLERDTYPGTLAAGSRDEFFPGMIVSIEGENELYYGVKLLGSWYGVSSDEFEGDLRLPCNGVIASGGAMARFKEKDLRKC